MLLPKKLRFWLFDRLSVKTMRYVTSVPRSEATGLTGRLYEMIADDFFINGSLTSRSRVPNLLAAIWVAGRESIIVDDQLDRTSKEAITALMSGINDCPYCGDMLISLVHAGGEHEVASAVFDSQVRDVQDPQMRARLAWVEAVSTPGVEELPALPFSERELPEVLASMMAMADINRFSHIVMDGSPVSLPGRLQAWVLRLLSGELRSTKVRPAEPGRSLSLLEPAELPADLAWAAPNPRIAEAMARWTATVEREAEGVVSPAVRDCVRVNLQTWNNERMPISRAWVEEEIGHLEGEDRDVARLALVLSKASYQIDESLVAPLLSGGQERFIRILAWASFAAARGFIGTVVKRAIPGRRSPDRPAILLSPTS
ncbi:MAG: carboxymuconolactone decarboxylase family protein [Planctomycetota bacterium]|jgi:AhpD family alkylhydroperoxidase